MSRYRAVMKGISRGSLWMVSCGPGHLNFRFNMNVSFAQCLHLTLIVKFLTPPRLDVPARAQRVS